MHQPGNVDVQADDPHACLAQGVHDVSGRATDVDGSEPAQIVASQKVPQNGRDLGRLDSTPLLVVHLVLKL